MLRHVLPRQIEGGWVGRLQSHYGALGSGYLYITPTHYHFTLIWN
jgi:hypothetical protein